MTTITFTPGGYRFIPGVFQYSGGVAAQPGLAIEHVRFAHPVPLVDGFARVAAHIKAADRPLTAFCACELRSPAPFTEAGFIAFNRVYVGTLAEWGIFKDEINPVARSNVCPEIDPPAAPSFHGFAFTTTAANAPASFVISGSGEAPEGKGTYGDFIVARGDVSAAGMRQKARAVLAKWSAVWAWSAQAGATPPRCSSTRSTTRIRSWATSWCAAAPPATA